MRQNGDAVQAGAAGGAGKLKVVFLCHCRSIMIDQECASGLTLARWQSLFSGPAEQEYVFSVGHTARSGPAVWTFPFCGPKWPIKHSPGFTLGIGFTPRVP